MIDIITQSINSWSTLLDSLIGFVPKLIATCTMIAAFLPPPEQNSILSRLHRIMNLIAFNFGKAANKDV